MGAVSFTLFKKGFFILFMLTILFSCLKDSTVEPVLRQPESCYDSSTEIAPPADLRDLIYGGTSLGPTYQLKGTHYTRKLVFNPMNTNEMVYVKMDLSLPSDEGRLWYYNFCTKESRLLSEQVNPLYLDWGANGMVVFNTTDDQLMKIIPEIDAAPSLFANEPWFKVGKWSPDGNFLYISGADGYKIYDFNGEFLVHWDGALPFRMIDWLDEEDILVYSNSTNRYQVLDWEINSRKDISDLESDYYYRGAYDQDQNRLFSIEVSDESPSGIFELDFENHKKTLIKELGEYYSFDFIDYSSDTDQILGHLWDDEWKDSAAHEYYRNSHILLLNGNGTNPREVILPH